jgi:hypothetical protein
MFAAAAMRSLVIVFLPLDTPPDAAIRFFTFSVSFALFLRQDLAREKSDLILRSAAF